MSNKIPIVPEIKQTTDKFENGAHKIAAILNSAFSPTEDVWTKIPFDFVRRQDGLEYSNGVVTVTRSGFYAFTAKFFLSGDPAGSHTLGIRAYIIDPVIGTSTEHTVLESKNDSSSFNFTRTVTGGEYLEAGATIEFQAFVNDPTLGALNLITQNTRFAMWEVR